MSVTFWCPEAPSTPTILYPDQDPTFVVDVSDLPEINVSNSNARVLIEMFGLPYNDELCGGIEVAQMDAVIQRLRYILASPEERAAFLEPTTVNDRVVTDDGAPAALTLGQVLSNALAEVAAESPYAGPSRALVRQTLLPSNQTIEGLMQEKRRGPTIVSFGRTDPYLVQQAQRFLDLFAQAKEHNYRVCWG